MRKKVLILGSTGMLGHMLFFFLESLDCYDLYDVSFRTKLRKESVILDVRNNEKVKDLIREIRPDFVVNCVGILIRGAGSDPGNAILINSYLPHFLSSLAREYDFRLIHISTDCVFSGNTGGYHEHDFRDADDVYGRTKALGELDNDRDLTIRTSIIGPELKNDGEGLMHWFLNQKDPVNGFADVYWSGLTTLELSVIVDRYIKNFSAGLINVSNNTKISKHDLLLLIAEVFGLKTQVIPKYGIGKDKSLIAAKETGEQVPDYRTMLEELHTVMLKREERLYSQYFNNR